MVVISDQHGHKDMSTERIVTIPGLNHRMDHPKTKPCLLVPRATIIYSENFAEIRPDRHSLQTYISNFSRRQQLISTINNHRITTNGGIPEGQKAIKPSKLATIRTQADLVYKSYITSAMLMLCKYQQSSLIYNIIRKSQLPIIM